MPGARGPHPNRVDEATEKAILEHCLAYPTHGPLHVAQQLTLKGVQVSSGGIRGVWSRHSLMTRHQRLLRLEGAVKERKVEITEEQMRLLERFSPEFRDRHIETHATRATWALNSAEYRFRFVLLIVISFVSVRLSTLSHCPNIGDHLCCLMYWRTMEAVRLRGIWFRGKRRCRRRDQCSKWRDTPSYLDKKIF